MSIYFWPLVTQTFVLFYLKPKYSLYVIDPDIDTNNVFILHNISAKFTAKY